jgi:uracil-DNA glycosylase
MSDAYDPGPPADFYSHLLAVPSYAPYAAYFWLDWGPIFYRGRLDGSARVLCIASDPGATERIAGRTLVGDAGQRVQGFLSKLGLTRSYLCLNAYAYGLMPSQASHAAALLRDPVHLAWRNELYDLAKSPSVEAIIAFGAQAQTAVNLWLGKADVPVFQLPHPSSRDEQSLLKQWQAALVKLEDLVTPDPDGLTDPQDYGTTFSESDYAKIPRGDLPFGCPNFLGDDAWLRKTGKSHASSVNRPHPDDRHTLIWTAPKSEGSE